MRPQRFKYIGEQIKFFEQQHTWEYVFGLEESYGCLVGTHARDKDAVVAVMALCEAAAFCKARGETLWDAMLKLYEKYGYYKEGLHSITLKGVDGVEKIQSIMSELRENPPASFGSFKILKIRDYKKNEIKDLKTGDVTETGLPSSNVLYYDLSEEAWVCIRPSGTEPKLKIYYGVKGSDFHDADTKLKELGEYVVDMIHQML